MTTSDIKSIFMLKPSSCHPSYLVTHHLQRLLHLIQTYGYAGLGIHFLNKVLNRQRHSRFCTKQSQCQTLSRLYSSMSMSPIGMGMLQGTAITAAIFDCTLLHMLSQVTYSSAGQGPQWIGDSELVCLMRSFQSGWSPCQSCRWWGLLLTAALPPAYSTSMLLLAWHWTS